MYKCLMLIVLEDARRVPRILFPVGAIPEAGSLLSAVRLSDRKFVKLSEDYGVENSFDSLDEWYVQTLRAEFGERYGLGPVSEVERF
jgi:hypothetical protein